MLRGVVLVRTDVSDELSPLYHHCDKNRLTRKNVSRNYQPTHATKNYTLMMEALSSSETSVLTRAKLCNMTEDPFLHLHFC
jgi:hypothetical protein